MRTERRHPYATTPALTRAVKICANALRDQGAKARRLELRSHSALVKGRHPRVPSHWSGPNVHLHVDIKTGSVYVNLTCLRGDDRTTALMRRQPYLRMLIQMNYALEHSEVVVRPDGFAVSMREPLCFTPSTAPKTFSNKLKAHINCLAAEIASAEATVHLSSIKDRASAVR